LNLIICVGVSCAKVKPINARKRPNRKIPTILSFLFFDLMREDVDFSSFKKKKTRTKRLNCLYILFLSFLGSPFIHIVYSLLSIEDEMKKKME
jgi:hypothetical protein